MEQDIKDEFIIIKIYLLAMVFAIGVIIGLLIK